MILATDFYNETLADRSDDLVVFQIASLMRLNRVHINVVFFYFLPFESYDNVL